MKQLYLFTFFVFLCSSIQAQDFEFFVKTTTPNETFTIPAVDGLYTYDYDVEIIQPFGGNTLATYNNVTGSLTHTFANPGSYLIKILEDSIFPALQFSFSPDRDKITNIARWGNNEWATMESAFENCTNLTLGASNTPNLTNVTSTNKMFKNATSLVDFQDKIGDWDMSNVRDMEQMFRDCSSFNEDLSNWDTSSAQILHRIFQGATSFDQDLGNWDVSNVTGTAAIFRDTVLSTSNYDKIIIGWGTLDSGETQIPTGLSIRADASHYCTSEAVRTTLSNTPYSWVFTDAGLDCSTVPNDDFFITTWETTSANESITIPTAGLGYGYYIDWGDGQTDNSLTGTTSHTYSDPGEHIVKIGGIFPRILFNNTGDKLKIKTIEQWGDIVWRDMSNAFNGCENLTINATDAPNLTNVTSFFSAFRACFNIGSPDLNHWDVSNINTMVNMFSGSNFNGNITNWDVGNVSRFSAMFSQTSFNQNISSWNIGERVPVVFSMSDMFKRNSAFNYSLNAWDMSKVIAIEEMFEDATSFDHSSASWDISSITNMENMFSGSGMSLENYDTTLLGWATLDAGETKIPQNITIGADGVTYCDTSAKTILANTYNWSFEGDVHICPEASKYITTWKTYYEESPNNRQITIPTASAYDYYYTVEWGDGETTTGHTGDAEHTYTTKGTYKIKISGNFPAIITNPNISDKALQIQSVDQWGTTAWESLESAFFNCRHFDIIATDAPNLSNVTSLRRMFWACVNIGNTNSGNIDLSAWNTSSITNMERMFDNNHSLKSANLGNWDVSSVSNFNSMFNGAFEFNENLNNWNVSKVKNFNDFLRGASEFDQDLSSWDISSLNSTNKMLDGTKLSVENYDKTLQGWATLDTGETQIPRDITLGALNVGYGNPTYRDILRSTYNWTFEGDIYQGIEEEKFITKWTITADDLSIPIYMFGTNNNYTVDWGDNTIESGFTGSTSHTYNTAGTYTVKIYGDFSQMSFFNREGKDKIIAIDQWGTNKWDGLIAAFSGCSNVKLYATDVPDLSEATNMAQAFLNTSAFEDVNNSLKDWDVRTITNFSLAFGGSNMNSDISGWNMEAAEEIGNMFENNAVFNQPIGNWTFINLNNCIRLFSNATSFNQDLSNWDVSKVRDFESMFSGATAFDQSLGDWDISSAQAGDFRGLDNMFKNAGLSTANYDATLLGWATLDPGETKIPTDIILDAGNSRYCIGETSRQNLTTNQNWAITDAGSECDTVAFITTWETTSPDESITIPTTGNGYNYTIDWGDGTIENNQTTNATHQYATPKQHKIKVWGDFPRIYFSNLAADKDKILSVDQWGTIKWTSMQNAFFGCSKLTIADGAGAPDLSKVTVLNNMFADTSVNTTGNLNSWDVSNVRSFYRMFISCPNFNQPLDQWDVSNATSLRGIFHHAINFNQDISGWNVGKCRNFAQMFLTSDNQTHLFNQDISSWNIGEFVTDTQNIEMYSMFKNAKNFDADLSSWNVSRVTNFNQMFYNSLSFDYNLGSWDISNATNMELMFGGVTLSQENYDNTLIGWATLNASETAIPTELTFDAGNSMYCFGAAAKELLTSDPYRWVITDGGRLACNTTDFFITTWETTSANESITIPTTGNGYHYDVDWGDGTASFGHTGNATHEYNSVKTYTVRIKGDFPRIYFNNTGDKAKIKSIEQWGNNPWASMEDAFNNCSNLELNAIDTPNLSGVTSLKNMFKNCKKLVDNGKQMDIWDVSSVTNMSSMFYSATIFDENITSWNVGKVTDFSNMFNRCAFNQPIGSWNIGEYATVTINMEGMFLGANSLFNQDISTWDMSKVASVKTMFLFNKDFDQPLGAWDISNMVDMSEMFFGAGLSSENYDTTLIGWATLTVGETQIPSGIALNAGTSQYCFGLEAKNFLTDDNGLNWTINDNGASCDLSDAFITTWETTMADENITIPTTGGGYNYTVDWGDGTIETGLTEDAIHVYKVAKTHTIKIMGDFPRFSSFKNLHSARQLRTVEQWGTIAWRTMDGAFLRCNNLRVLATDAPDLSNVTSLSQMFRNCSNLQSPDFSNWDTSNITNMGFMFTHATNFNGNISTWDVGKVVNFSTMLLGAVGFNQNISSWNIGEHVTGTITMNSMLIDTENFDQNLGAWNLEKVTDISGILNNSGISTTNYDATLIGWAANPNTPSALHLLAFNVTYCFGETARDTLTDPNGLNWSISDGGASCDLSEAFITTWNINNSNEEIVIPVPGTGLDFDVDWGDGTITNESEEAYHTYVTPGTYTIRVLGDFQQIRFNGNADRRKIQTIEQWGNNQWTSMESAFKGCSALEINATDAPDLSIVTSMVSMFENGACVDNGGNLGNWNTGAVLSMDSMFRNAYMLENINTWNVSSVQSIDYMFSSTEDFNEPLDQWDTSNLESAVGAFSSTKRFDQSLGDWDISKVTNFTDIFKGSIGFSTENYDATLKGWATLDQGETTIPTNVSFSDEGLTYCAAAFERNELDTTYQWNILENAESACENESAFITNWSITVGDQSIEIPTLGDGYLYTVDWGDGTVENGFTGNATHTYTLNIKTSHIIQVKITGSFPRIFFNNSGDKDKIRAINQWGTQQWASMDSAFKGCANLKLRADDIPNLSQATSIQQMFASATAFSDEKDRMGQWDVSSIKNMFGTFRNTSVFNEDISNWTTTSVENIGSMFENANSFNQDISRWDVSNLSRAIEINGFYLGSLTTTFSNTSFSDANYDRLLMGWFTDTSGVSNDGIDDVPDLQALNIDNSYCTGSIARNHLIETHNWVINDEGESCTDAFITKWSVGAGEDIIIPVFDVFIAHDYNVDWGDGTFSSDVTSTISHTYTSAGTYTVKVTGNMPSIFYGNNIDPSIKARLQTIEQWGTQKWSHLSTSFAGCTNLKLNAIDSPDLSGIRSLSSMFSGCTNLEDLKDQIGNWDMSTITDTTGIFENCNLFNENVANWDISKVEFMSDILTNTGMSQENYDATLIGWATLDNGETQIPTDITLDANATYCLAEGARTLLTSDTYKWTINDGGLRCTEKAAINVYLLGAALNPKSGEEQLMRDDLRSTAVMPSTSPYSDAIKTSESILDNTSNAGDTIVDWVWVELRDPNDSTILIEGRSALLQRDGDVVDIDGVSPISFEADSGAYYVVVNHRNHLAIRSKDPIIFDSVPVPIDFSSSPSTIEGGLNAVTQLANGKYAIYAGDVDGNGQTQNSDINILSGSLGSSGYQAGDADMNGQIQNTDINSIVVPCIGKAEQF